MKLTIRPRDELPVVAEKGMLKWTPLFQAWNSLPPDKAIHVEAPTSSARGCGALKGAVSKALRKMNIQAEVVSDPNANPPGVWVYRKQAQAKPEAANGTAPLAHGLPEHAGAKGAGQS